MNQGKMTALAAVLTAGALLAGCGQGEPNKEYYVKLKEEAAAVTVMVQPMAAQSPVILAQADTSKLKPAESSGVWVFDSESRTYGKGIDKTKADEIKGLLEKADQGAVRTGNMTQTKILDGFLLTYPTGERIGYYLGDGEILRYKDGTNYDVLVPDAGVISSLRAICKELNKKAEGTPQWLGYMNKDNITSLKAVSSGQSRTVGYGKNLSLGWLDTIGRDLQNLNVDKDVKVQSLKSMMSADYRLNGKELYLTFSETFSKGGQTYPATLRINLYEDGRLCIASNQLDYVLLYQIQKDGKWQTLHNDLQKILDGKNKEAVPVIKVPMTGTTTATRLEREDITAVYTVNRENMSFAQLADEQDMIKVIDTVNGLNAYSRGVLTPKEGQTANGFYVVLKDGTTYTYKAFDDMIYVTENPYGNGGSVSNFSVVSGTLGQFKKTADTMAENHPGNAQWLTVMNGDNLVRMHATYRTNAVVTSSYYITEGTKRDKINEALKKLTMEDGILEKKQSMPAFQSAGYELTLDFNTGVTIQIQLFTDNTMLISSSDKSQVLGYQVKNDAALQGLRKAIDEVFGFSAVQPAAASAR